MKTPTVLLLVILTAARHGEGRRGRHVRQVEGNPLESVVQQLSTALEELQSKVDAMQNQLDSASQHAAFLAQFSENNHEATDQGPYKFDQVIFNDGNAYDPTTGIFTAPSSGIYVFSAQIFTDGSVMEHPFVDIEVNNATVSRMAFSNSVGSNGDESEDSDSTSITLRLQAGDQVWVASEENLNYHYWGDFHTFFSGALLHAYPPQ